MGKLSGRLKEALVREILNAKEGTLDNHYMTTSKGSFTRNEMASEIRNETEIGLQQMESILKLSIFLLEKGDKKI